MRRLVCKDAQARGSSTLVEVGSVLCYLFQLFVVEVTTKLAWSNLMMFPSLDIGACTKPTNKLS